MVLCPEETNLLAIAGEALSESLLPPPFKLRFSNHDTGRQMTIYADGLNVWVGSVWHSGRYEFNDDGKIGGIQPGFEFARPVIDKFFASLRLAVAQRDQLRAEAAERAEADREAERTAKIARIRAAIETPAP